MRLSLLFLLFASLAHADPQATVWARNPSAVRKFFPADKYRMMDAEAEAKELDESGYLKPHVRAALFHKLNLEESVQGLDDMDKDMLVMGARFETLESLKKHFRMLNEAQLKSLQHEVREMAKK